MTLPPKHALRASLKGALPVTGQSPLHGSTGQPVSPAHAARRTDAHGGIA